MDVDTKEILKEMLSSQGREREALDRVIFTITAGTLSLSITLISSSSHIFTGLSILFWSWGVLICGLVAILLAYQFSTTYFEWCATGIAKNTIKSVKDLEWNWRRVVSEIFNYVSLISTIAGMVLFAVFGYLNLR